MIFFWKGGWPVAIHLVLMWTDIRDESGNDVNSSLRLQDLMGSKEPLCVLEQSINMMNVVFTKHYFNSPV